VGFAPRLVVLLGEKFSFSGASQLSYIAEEEVTRPDKKKVAAFQTLGIKGILLENPTKKGLT
jgi:hypothetical protein